MMTKTYKPISIRFVTLSALVYQVANLTAMEFVINALMSDEPRKSHNSTVLTIKEESAASIDLVRWGAFEWKNGNFLLRLTPERDQRVPLQEENTGDTLVLTSIFNEV